MYNTSYILACDKDHVYTALNRFDPKQNAFEGEYSLLHNTYSRDQYFLARFLIEHVAHPLVFLNSESDRYHEVIHNYGHFREDDISRYVQERVLQENEFEQTLTVQQSIGQLQLLIAKKMIEKELESVQNTPSSSERDTYVLLGKDWAFRWSVNTINDLVEQGRA
ncbi:hypothetical protein [Alicyclobacillus cycloheptanicus]|uniref:Isopentenyl phosphate kinase n=1 Tax=Alicyclobacillus cycloheptanicus TaxID=1457 RepID=A0ABT9XKB8_9BACL|nr:hypothetical protein [Alicyclobacillus cycloheptanicus]MDQ0190233.1 isopentenyl phosphate kinase [Alicyclobacillus cycloheptanicus]